MILFNSQCFMFLLWFEWSTSTCTVYSKPEDGGLSLLVRRSDTGSDPVEGKKFPVGWLSLSVLLSPGGNNSRINQTCSQIFTGEVMCHCFIPLYIWYKHMHSQDHLHAAPLASVDLLSQLMQFLPVAILIWYISICSLKSFLLLTYNKFCAEVERTLS